MLDKLLLRFLKRAGFGILPGWCTLCSRPTLFRIRGDNFREDVWCSHCSSFNRNRQMFYIFQEELRKGAKDPRTVTIWNTENDRCLHERLRHLFASTYASSEYLGPDLRSGSVVNGVLHQDICNTSFPPRAFDFVLSSDVLEHVPDPQKALNEISRILKPKGKFIFTVPFAEGAAQSDTRARLQEDGSIEYLRPPIYHGDPVRPEGILVYVIFGEDLEDMCRRAGLIYRKRKLYHPFYGILGSNALVFVAEKPGEVEKTPEPLSPDDCSHTFSTMKI